MMRRREPYRDTYIEIDGMALRARRFVEYVREAPLNRDEAQVLAQRARNAAREFEHLANVLDIEVADPIIEAT